MRLSGPAGRRLLLRGAEPRHRARHYLAARARTAHPLQTSKAGGRNLFRCEARILIARLGATRLCRLDTLCQP